MLQALRDVLDEDAEPFTIKLWQILVSRVGQGGAEWLLSWCMSGASEPGCGAWLPLLAAKGGCAVNIALLMFLQMDVCQPAGLLLPAPVDLRAAQAGARRGCPVMHELLMPACAPLCRGVANLPTRCVLGSTTCSHAA